VCVFVRSRAVVGFLCVLQRFCVGGFWGLISFMGDRVVRLRNSYRRNGATALRIEFCVCFSLLVMAIIAGRFKKRFSCAEGLRMD
jgi:hypothetical protein